MARWNSFSAPEKRLLWAQSRESRFLGSQPDLGAQDYFRLVPSYPQNSLPDDLQRKLTLPGFQHQRVRQNSSVFRQRPVITEYLGSFTALKGQGRPKVGAIQDVEKLHPELHAGTRGNAPDGEVLV